MTYLDRWDTTLTLLFILLVDIVSNNPLEILFFGLSSTAFDLPESFLAKVLATAGLWTLSRTHLSNKALLLVSVASSHLMLLHRNRLALQRNWKEAILSLGLVCLIFTRIWGFQSLDNLPNWLVLGSQYNLSQTVLDQIQFSSVSIYRICSKICDALELETLKTPNLVITWMDDSSIKILCTVQDAISYSIHLNDKHIGTSKGSEIQIHGLEQDTEYQIYVSAAYFPLLDFKSPTLLFKTLPAQPIQGSQKIVEEEQTEKLEKVSYLKRRVKQLKDARAEAQTRTTELETKLQIQQKHLESLLHLKQEYDVQIQQLDAHKIEEMHQMQLQASKQLSGLEEQTSRLRIHGDALKKQIETLYHQMDRLRQSSGPDMREMLQQRAQLEADSQRLQTLLSQESKIKMSLLQQLSAAKRRVNHF
ncbi:hypothetical protein EDD86DRAFT_208558 [Gorgonomyces haynaldii]|nr:hypothetical protein EDD86DRAFT_208558 [Gorgonomyces haynaldii]